MSTSSRSNGKARPSRSSRSTDIVITVQNHLSARRVVRAAVLAVTVGLAASACAQQAASVPPLSVQGRQGVAPPLARAQDLDIVADQLSRGEERAAMATWSRFVEANASRLRVQGDLDRIVSRMVAEASRKARSLPVPQEDARRAEPARPPTRSAEDMQGLQLQKSIQKQPKSVEQLGNVSKKLSDTAAAIIQNVK